MKKIVKKERPLFRLTNWGSGNRNGQSPQEDVLNIYASDLRNAEVGELFSPENFIACHDLEEHESLEIVSKTDRGVAGIFKRTCVSYSYLEPGQDEKKLVWFELHK